MKRLYFFLATPILLLISASFTMLNPSLTMSEDYRCVGGEMDYEIFTELGINPNNPPEGYWDKTGYNYVLLSDDRVDTLGVFIAARQSITGEPRFVVFEDILEEYDIEYEDTPQGNFPLLYREINRRYQSQVDYIKQYMAFAVADEQKTKVPAYITLAQGILESNSGRSKLAKTANNHFGIKCFSKTCSKGHCLNYTDDSHKDFFRTFKTVKDSFHEHSRLLKKTKLGGKPRYGKLFELDRDDYIGWAKGLQDCGYATSSKYAEKLISLIERYHLVKSTRKNSEPV